MLGGFRTRLSITVVALVVATAAIVAVLSYVLVESSLRRQLVDAAIAQAEFNIGVLASQEVLPSGAQRTEFEQSLLADRFLQRGSQGVYVEFSGSDDPFASDFSLVDAGSLLDRRLRDLVAAGRYGYEYVAVGGESRLVVGGRRPPLGPDFYFFFSAEEVDGALAELRRVLLIAGIGVAVAGALAARLIARGVLRPVRIASRAAGLMADGDLSVRLPVESRDEFGAWAESFNQMASSLEAQVDQLQQARAREQRFVADVSHELRTPLTALVAEAEMLRSHMDEMPPEAQRVSELLSGDVRRLRHLVQDLLEISRLDAASVAESADDVAVAPFLHAVLADRLPDAALHLPDEITVHCDRRALERVVGNLLDNAARHAPGAPVSVAARLDRGELEVGVADEGPGVPEDALPHLFDRFFSPDTARTGGTGLGLAIAKAHAERMGGSLDVRPNQPSGLVFTLRIPVTESLQTGDADENRPRHAEGEAI